MSMHKELSVKSRVRGDFHARFCERVRVKLPRSTRPCTALGLDVNIWTPDTEEQMRMTKIRRPDFITKDNPVGK